jgi:flagellar capping protein FliD
MRTYVFNATLPSGMVSAVSSNQQASQKDLDKRIEAGGRKLDLKRTRLQAQFARMESAVAQLQAQGQRMQSQLGQG